LTAVVVAALFGVSLVFAPLVAAIPPAAYAPALIIVGAMMITPILKIDFDDYTELIPAFTVIALMSFTYNIGVGITAGLVLYPLFKLAAGGAKYTPDSGCSAGYRYFFTSSTHTNSYNSQNDLSFE